MTREVYLFRRGGKYPMAVDFGENTAGSTTGSLPPGTTVSSATVSVESKPTGATDPTLSAVTINTTAEYVNGRSCSAGEAALWDATMASDQAYGPYTLKITPTISSTHILPEFVRFCVEPA